jgi:hypothetical protein
MSADTGGERLPLSYGQEGLWFIQAMNPRSAAYNLHVAIRVRASVEAAALHRALRLVLDRHEILRAVFPAEDGRPVQVIRAPCDPDLAIVELDGSAVVTEVIHRLSHEPFDLAAGPLFRAHLLRSGADADVILLVVHHLVCDGRSSGLLVNELMHAYHDIVAGNLPAPAAPDTRYRDYVIRQREMVIDGRGEVHLEHWRKELGVGSSLISLPTDRPRPSTQSLSGACEEILLDAELADRLRDIARREGTTLYVLLLAAFQTLLRRYTGDDEIRVGTPLAARAIE